MATKRRKKRKKKVLSPDEKRLKKLQSDHKSWARSIFRSTGFIGFTKLRDKDFILKGGTQSDFDDVYAYENVIVLVEYTVSKNIGQHLKSKKIVYDKIRGDEGAFLSVLSDMCDEFKDYIDGPYNLNEFEIRIVYCSRYSFDPKYKIEVPGPCYLDYPELRYFRSVTDSIKISGRAELFEFLGVPYNSVGINGKIGTSTSSQEFSGSILPEANSNFKKGFKVVSFYADADALLRRTYVLRKQGWRDSAGVYQRMISSGKIKSIRKHLKSNKGVFVNNIIATLDDDTKILDAKGNTSDPATIKTIQPVRIQIPDRMNTVGLIDGQHRTFSYHETKPDDPDIKQLRSRQNLLVTGIIYPPKLSERDREKFEAGLFLEINSTQTNAKSDLKQAINLILKPFSDESIARNVLNVLDRHSGPLSGHIEQYWFDEDKLKTTSVVSYGLKPLVKTSGKDSLFTLWKQSSKEEMVTNENYDLLEEYSKFCATNINSLIGAVKMLLPNDLWTPDRKIDGRLITTTTINSLLICLRLLIENDKVGDFNFYADKLSSLKVGDFEGFHSSQYGRMARELFKRYFQ